MSKNNKLLLLLTTTTSMCTTMGTRPHTVRSMHTPWQGSIGTSTGDSSGLCNFIPIYSCK